MAEITTMTVVQAALILFREGAEALLIIAALVAYLTRIGAPEKARVLYSGLWLAVAASILLAWVFWTVFGGEHDDLVEGVTLVFASAMLLYVSGWLYGKSDQRAWQGFLKNQVDQASRVGAGMFSLAAVAFLAVFREGAETTLFLHALALDSGGWGLSMIAGIALGSVTLFVMFAIVKSMAVRLPLKPFFTVTAGFLFVMGILFAGQSVQEFQEMGWLSYNDAPVPDGLVEMGISASWEGFALQLSILLIGGFVLWLTTNRKAAKAKQDLIHAESH